MFDAGGNSISSKDIIPGTNIIGTFKCENGGVPHTFTKLVSAMVTAHKKGNLGCPVCAGFEIVEGVNDFKTRNPEIAQFWDYVNNTVKPEQVYYKSRNKYHFICKRDKEKRIGYENIILWNICS